MKEILLRSEEPLKFFSQDEVFVCPEESQFYAHCLELWVLNQCLESELVVEFGCGDGSPVIHALLKTQFAGSIHGYEMNCLACDVANSRIEQHKLSRQYIIHNQSFFESSRPKAKYLIANPPYLPAPDNKISMPLLHGGIDGAAITKRLLSLNYPNVLLMVSSYSNPVDTINYAINQNYCVADFMISPLRFGYYSSDPKVENSILELRKYHKAFYSKHIYFLAGVLFKKQDEPVVDLSTELIQAMTVL